MKDVGWHEIHISPDGTWFIGYAKVGENDVIVHDKFHPKEYYSVISNNILAGVGVNEFTALCQGNKITLSINGTFEAEVDDTDIWFDAGKVGVAVRSWKSLPVMIDLDWVKVSQP